MTDRETLTAMLDAAGVVWKIENPDEPQKITVEAADGEHNLGYSGFFTVFEFDHEGALITVAAWE